MWIWAEDIESGLILISASQEPVIPLLSLVHPFDPIPIPSLIDNGPRLKVYTSKEYGDRMEQTLKISVTKELQGTSRYGYKIT